MTPINAAVLLAAGFTAGGMNAVVGAGTLVTFPALLAIGLPPVTANVSNTLGILPGSFTGAYGYRHQLGSVRHLLQQMVVPATAGGLTGAALVLVLPARAFSAVVPVLLLAAAALVAHVDWAAVGLLAVSSALGGTVGSRYGRNLPDALLRAFVVLLAVGVAIKQMMS